MTYTIPNLVKDGVDTFSINVVVPPSADTSEGNRTTLIKEYPMDGYHFIFNGDGYKTTDLSDDLVNSYVTELTARIKYTGEKKRISLRDRIYVNAQVRELLPVYANGFLRKAKVNSGVKNVSFDIFNQIESGNIDIEDVDFSIEVDNGIGASAEARFIDIKGTSKNGKIVAIDFDEDPKMNISSASFLGSAGNFRTTHVTSFKNLNKNNSNIDEFIENLPVNIDYEVEVELNSNINMDSMTTEKIVKSIIPPNFLHYLDEVSAKLNIEVPLSVVTDSLVLIDTLDFNLNTDSESEVESGKFKLLVDNGFPFDANTALYFMDDMGIIIDSLWTNETILRASVNNAGKVSSSTRSVIEFTITAEKMDVIKSATKLYIEAGFHTFDISDPGKKFFKIYSNYSFAFKLIGDFNYQLAN